VLRFLQHTKRLFCGFFVGIELKLEMKKKN
jgi:hypothetical protein